VTPSPNPYNNPRDPNEWGFRVPLLVISPYIKHSGYISNGTTSGFPWRSQSAILQLIESNFGLLTLGGDDGQEGHTDELADMFDMAKTPAPYVAITEPPGWAPPALSGSQSVIGQCYSGFGKAGSARHRKMLHGHKPLRAPPAQAVTRQWLSTPLRPRK
jgi:Phosphoesterase family